MALQNANGFASACLRTHNQQTSIHPIHNSGTELLWFDRKHHGKQSAKGQ